ncbi:MAG: cupin domain-containing protein [Hormoscilla sp. SP5CHS1]|nr:cupin domain-containing protein [Hormoscilla sp. SP12CHS1]MBC6452560.1 cupin domain-containing protein [Hormoscilla sp. SP5CHS1]
MTEPALTAKTGQNFATADLGAFSQLRQYTFAAPAVPIELEGKVFLNQLLDLTSAEISLNNIPPGKSVPFYHKHWLNEEIYIFVRGQGEFQVDDCVFPVQEGTAVRVSPEGERCLRNTSDVEDLCSIVIQSRASSYRGHTIIDGVAVEKKVSWVGKKRI